MAHEQPARHFGGNGKAAPMRGPAKEPTGHSISIGNGSPDKAHKAVKKLLSKEARAGAMFVIQQQTGNSAPSQPS